MRLKVYVAEVSIDEEEVVVVLHRHAGLQHPHHVILDHEIQAAPGWPGRGCTLHIIRYI